VKPSAPLTEQIRESLERMMISIGNAKADAFIRNIETLYTEQLKQPVRRKEKMRLSNFPSRRNCKGLIIFFSSITGLLLKHWK